MTAKLDLDGIITVINTPFATTGEIDHSALRRNVDYALRAGVVGFLAPGKASEVDNLTDDERFAMVETIVDEVAGSAVVIGGASAPGAKRRLDNARELSRIGCDGVLVELASGSDLRCELSQIAGVTDGFVMLQDWDPVGFGIPVDDIVEAFREIEAFRSLKVEVVPAGVKYTRVRDATAGLLHLAGGWAVTQMIEGLDRGVDAFMPTGLHEVYTAIYRSYRCGHRDRAVELFDSILPILTFSNQTLDISIRFFKKLLCAQGVYATDLTRTLRDPFDAYHDRIATELIAKAIGIMDGL